MDNLPMTRLDSFSYMDDLFEVKSVDLTVNTSAKCYVDGIGIHYVPLAGISNDPLHVLIPWARVIEVFYRP